MRARPLHRKWAVLGRIRREINSKFICVGRPSRRITGLQSHCPCFFVSSVKVRIRDWDVYFSLV
jgi:hypothetical protein